MLTKLLKSTFALILIVGLISCGKDSSGPDPSEAPTFPDLTASEPDVSFFENNNPQKIALNKNQDTSNFYAASGLALSGAWLTSIGQIYGAFFQQADKENAEFKDGMWVWEYSSNFQSQSASFRITAKEGTSDVSWAMYWSFNDGQGNKVDNYKIIQGTVAKDGSGGNWTFNSLDPDSGQEAPAIKTEWTVSSETESQVIMKVYDEGSLASTITYNKNDPEYTMHFTYTDGSDDATVFWNTDTKMGYVLQGGTKMCWDSSFQNVACS